MEKGKHSPAALENLITLSRDGRSTEGAEDLFSSSDCHVHCEVAASR